MPEAAPVIAVDGTAGSGKGTLARNLANELGWHYLDSGALYRAAGLAVLQADTDPDDAVACGGIAQAMQVEIETRPESIRILLDGTDVTTRVRAPEVGRVASRISVHPEVRRALLDHQRAARRMPGLVADGRDMGTVVFPDACLKFHLIASLEVRARRRQHQLEEMGINARLNTLIDELNQRDLQDMRRGESPLVQAPDACLIDTSEQSIEEVHAKARACLPGILTPSDKGTHP
ncbi:MAG: (d)CMP kinase [Gammaproteobacteria bacterium]|nr:(d)CMP kinase [Gammaproteobacteria bacterium]MDE0301845.1 (d)CMP kinase [Gammaproteobacteria bacterium]